MASSTRARSLVITLHLCLCAMLFTAPDLAEARGKTGCLTFGQAIIPPQRGLIRETALTFAAQGLVQDTQRFGALLKKLPISPAELQLFHSLQVRAPSDRLSRRDGVLLGRLARQIFTATGENIVRTGILLAHESGREAVPLEQGHRPSRVPMIRGPRFWEHLWQKQREDPFTVTLTQYFPSDDQAHQQDWYSTRIRKLKAEPQPTLARAIVMHYSKRIERLCRTAAPQVVVAVPSTTRKNGSALLLAEAIGQLVGVPFAAEAIQNSTQKARTPQKKLPGIQLRLANTSQTFVIDPQQVKGRKVLLVDDNLASGVTAEEIRLRLYQAGAEKVVMLSFGKAPMP